MAKTGKKTILLQMKSIDLIEETINFADDKAANSGIRLTIDYTHDVGLKLSVAGPKDKINLFEHQIREFISTLEEEYRSQ